MNLDILTVVIFSYLVGSMPFGLLLTKIFLKKDLRKFGSAVHSGFGLGFERLVMFVTGMSNIRDVIPFPRTPQNAEF